MAGKNTGAEIMDDWKRRIIMLGEKNYNGYKKSSLFFFLFLNDKKT